MKERKSILWGGGERPVGLPSPDWSQSRLVTVQTGPSLDYCLSPLCLITEAVCLATLETPSNN